MPSLGRRIEAVPRCAAEGTADAVRHESWMNMEQEAGWVSGKTINPEKKTRLNRLPGDRLPASARSKARVLVLYAQVSHKLASVRHRFVPARQDGESNGPATILAILTPKSLTLHPDGQIWCGRLLSINERAQCSGSGRMGIES